MSMGSSVTNVAALRLILNVLMTVMRLFLHLLRENFLLREKKNNINEWNYSDHPSTHLLRYSPSDEHTHKLKLRTSFSDITIFRFTTMFSTFSCWIIIH